MHFARSLRSKSSLEGGVSKVVLNIQHPFETSMNVVPSDDCQNVVAKIS